MTSESLQIILDRTEERFNSGYNCAESVFMAGAEMMGKDGPPSVMTGFGGGIARQASLCGALTGGIAAIGLACGRVERSDNEAKAKVYGLVSELFGRFRDEFGSELCPQVCGYDLSTPEGLQGFVQNDTHRKVCSRFVLWTVEILGELLSKDQA
jgi:C_GCAxxG_C_C family probable redox protein